MISLEIAQLICYTFSKNWSAIFTLCLKNRLLLASISHWTWSINKRESKEESDVDNYIVRLVASETMLNDWKWKKKHTIKEREELNKIFHVKTEVNPIFTTRAYWSVKPSFSGFVWSCFSTSTFGLIKTNKDYGQKNNICKDYG